MNDEENGYGCEPVYAVVDDSDDFQDYAYKNGTLVEDGVLIGFEILNPRTGEWELKLFNDIKFASRKR